MKIVGVTSCIAGLAHTPMAAKALEKAAAQLGHHIKVEQQGALGQVNKLTEEDIAAADFVLIASDQTVKDAERFEDTKIVRVKIGHAVNNAEAVLTKAVEAISAQK
ncbi:PTS fructose transporter subunit IIB [Paenibacillus polymyxa]|uniref:PTS fructose transporter subunit IIB n=1 Tax=Paenibacillus TaxID=44249 RepID=UPI00042E5D1A|nr:MULTISPECIES: fructose PTS transporter subunit IIB [Paenibacillus]AHM63938.1 PTS system transporter subunit IIB [Paenibacillus polymyxa SQR-21]KAF6654955.1 PTS fructose transporter subunit IIB [Paenibacillus sp. EKM301P]RFT93238.1 PTS fructose transporter subunit IIB [Paenibacillus jamilae]RPE11172.1 PTS fructose transporter subunit IIB [Paenibacillus polymyxa]UBS87534.1 fructose PTS transporter subunit IIB [Paenibacillus polymyxa]